MIAGLFFWLCAKCGWICSFLGSIFRSQHDRLRLESAVRIDGMLPCRWLESADDAERTFAPESPTRISFRPICHGIEKFSTGPNDDRSGGRFPIPKSMI